MKNADFGESMASDGTHSMFTMAIDGVRSSWLITLPPCCLRDSLSKNASAFHSLAFTVVDMLRIVLVVRVGDQFH